MKKDKQKTKEKIDPVIVPMKEKNLLSTGSTLLNLACSNHYIGGLLKGYYYLFVGDSDSGKTFVSMAMFAEADMNPRFDGYRLIHDNPEDGMLMDLDSLFNERVADRVEPPRKNKKGEPIWSDSIESFYYNLDDAIKVGKPFVYILDSMDAITAEADDAKFEEEKKAARKTEEKKPDDEAVKKPTGSYGMAKAKKNSQNLRRVLKGLRKTKSILVIIAQTRDAIDGWEKNRGGGRALAFYSTMQMWTSIKTKIRKNINGKDRDIGTQVAINVKRNRITGRRSSCMMSIYPSFGIDDIGDCVDYLVEEKKWRKKGNKIVAKSFGLTATREKIIRMIEKDSKENDLRKIVGDCWKEIQEASALKRKNKYAMVEL